MQSITSSDATHAWLWFLGISINLPPPPKNSRRGWAVPTRSTGTAHARIAQLTLRNHAAVLLCHHHHHHVWCYVLQDGITHVSDPAGCRHMTPASLALAAATTAFMRSADCTLPAWDKRCNKQVVMRGCAPAQLHHLPAASSACCIICLLHPAD
jgi:hypothetical protein